MAGSVQVLAPLSRPVAVLLEPLRVALLGWGLVLINMAAVWAGARTGHPMVWSIVVGGVDGALIAMIAVARASAKFQAVITALLGGLSLNQISGDAGFLKTVADSMHHFVDSFVSGFSADLTSAGDEGLHQTIEAAILQIVWTAILVIVTSLILEWTRTSMGSDESR